MRDAVALCCPSRVAAIVCLLVCVAVPVALVAVHIDRNPLFSPVDEAQHFDYVQRIADGGVPRLGQTLLPSTDRLYACAGRAAPGWVPDCGRPAVVDLARIDQTNDQYEAQQPPLYYAVTAVLRWPFIHLLGMSRLDGTRFTGAIWLAAGLLLLWLAGTLIGLDWLLVGAAVLLLCVAPNVIYAASIVSNDAASVLAGAVVALLGAIGWRRPGRLPWWAFTLAALVVSMVKTLDVLAVLVVALLFAVSAARGSAAASGGERGKRVLAAWFPCAGAMLLGAAVGAIGWTLVYQRLAVVPNLSALPAFMVMRRAFAGSDVSVLFKQAIRMLDPMTDSSVPGQFFRSSATPAQPGATLAVRLAKVDAELIRFLIFGVGLGIFVTRRRDWPGWLGLVSMVTLFAGGCLLGVSILHAYGYRSGIPGRYGLSVTPLLMLALAGLLRGRGSACSALWVFATLSAGLSFFFMYA